MCMYKVLFCRYAMFKHLLQFGKGARSEVLVSISVDGHQGEASFYGLGVYVYIGCCKSIKTFLCP